jgi:hypothetical protein
MKLSETVEGLQEDLARLAGLGEDDAVTEAATRLLGALGGPATVRLLDLLGQAATELGDQLPSGRVELRIAGRDAELVYVDDSGAPPESDLSDDQPARISLRLPEQLKAVIEQTAAREGVSTNSWIVRALSRSTSRGRSFQSSKRLTGYGWS